MACKSLEYQNRQFNGWNMMTGKAQSQCSMLDKADGSDPVILWLSFYKIQNMIRELDYFNFNEPNK